MATEPALQDNLVEYQNAYYKVGTRRMEVKDTKVVDESYYILTLAALAKELKLRGRNRAKVIMGVGLPLTRFGAEKREFVDYLSRQNEVHFKFEGEHFNIRIQKVMIYPQCYGAVVDIITRKLREFTERIYNTLKELGFNSNVSQIIFVGGGASVMKHFGKMEGPNIHYIEDIRANAKGYEYLTKMSMRGKAGL